MTWQELHNAEQAAKAAIREYRGALRRVRPIVLDRDAKRRFDTFLAHSEAARRLPSEHERITAEIRHEEEVSRRLGAGAARHHARAVRTFVDEARAHVARTRRDVSASFPDALDHVDGNGMIMLALLRVQSLPLLASASAATLLSTYRAAVERKDARGLVEAEIIEDLVASGAGLASGEADLPIVKQLRELVTDVQDLRLPANLPDLDALLADLDRLDSRADLAKVDPINVDVDETAAAAFEEQREAMEQAGGPSDADDQAALHAEIGAS